MEKERELEGEVGDDEDGLSVSSYETGLETPFVGLEDKDKDKDKDDDDKDGADTGTPAPPPKSLANGGLQLGSDVSTSTEQGQGMQRRKSVRVSLKPTYAAAPPPVYDDYDAGIDAGVVGNGNGKGKGKGESVGREVPDMWEDSSEEDVEYATARRMLARVGSGSGSGSGRRRKK
jgi:hypothetical protein